MKKEKKFIFSPQNIDCVKEWIYCQKFNTFFKLLMIAASISFSFAILRFSQGNMPMFKANVIGVTVFTFIMIMLYRYNKTYHFFSRLFILTTFLLASMSMSMAEQGSRAIWLASIAVAAFYFRDQKEGVAWTIFFILFTMAKEHFYFEHIGSLNVVDTITLIANFILIATMLFWYEKIKIKDQENLKKQNVILNEKVKERTQELELLSHTDHLTGLFNRRSLYEVQQRLLNTLTRDSKSFVFVMTDVDYFKRYNDHYGHVMGDEALQRVANVLKENLSRGSDYAFRLGGEEFCMIMTGLTPNEAFEHVETIRHKIEGLNIEHLNRADETRLTMSFGIEHVIPDKLTTFDKIYKAADEKLYQSKENGRNRVTI